MGINAVSANSINILSGNQISTEQAGSETQEKTGQAEREATGIANQTKSEKTVTKACEIEAYKKKLWKEIHFISWDPDTQIAIRFSDKAIERIMNDSKYKNQIMENLRIQASCTKTQHTYIYSINEADTNIRDCKDPVRGAALFEEAISDKDYLYIKRENEWDDRMELILESQSAIPSDNYNNIRYTIGMPKSVFNGKASQGIQKSIYNFMKKYTDGEASKEELKQYFSDICKELRINNVQKRHTTGTNPEDNKKIISQVYAQFQGFNAQTMSWACFEAGKSIAAQYGETDYSGWVYYDTDYRNKCESTHTFLKEIANELTEEWGANPADFDQAEEECGLRITGMDFDSCWNKIARDINMCSLKDIKNPDFSETVSSGERFSFFYKAVAEDIGKFQGTLEEQKGVILLELGERKWKLDVPFNNSTVLGDLAYNFNVGSLFERYANDNPMILRLLKHFNVFSLFCRRDII